jgi:predicted O-methyltransferase YrrM
MRNQEMEKRICLNKSVLDFMESKLTPESFVLEFGGGWSSRWFADRCGHLIVIETDSKWANTISKELAGRGHIFVPRIGLQYLGDVAKKLTGVEADLALIDGLERMRFLSIVAAWPLIKPGGWLVFDDAQRVQHLESVKELTKRAGEPIALQWQPGDIETAKARLALAWQKPNESQ